MVMTMHGGGVDEEGRECECAMYRRWAILYDFNCGGDEYRSLPGVRSHAWCSTRVFGLVRGIYGINMVVNPESHG
jgi:hypothetical protein